MGATKNRLLIFILTITLFTILIPFTTVAINDSTLSLSADTTDLGTVLKQEKTFTSTLTIVYNYGPISIPGGSRLRLLPNNRNPTIIQLSVTSKPDWCTVNLSETNISVPIESLLRAGIKQNEVTVTGIINTTSVKADTTAEITIQANAPKNGMIKASSSTLSYSVEVGFIPNISYQLNQKTLSPLKPDTYGNFSVKINNTSNDKITVSINQNQSSPYFIVSIPSAIDINKDASQTITIPIRAIELNSSVNETSKLGFEISYYMTSDSTKLGLSQSFEITRSILYQPEKEDAIDLAPAFIGIAVIFLLIIGFFSFLKLRQNPDGLQIRIPFRRKK